MEVPLTKGYVALVSPENYDEVMQFKWYATVGQWTVYARTDRIGIGRLLMHRFVMKAAPFQVIHHINNNGLHNYKENLSKMFQSDHARFSRPRKNKTSKYKGVCKFRNKWAAEITINYKKTHLGIFNTEEEAALAYNAASLNMLGSSYPINIVEEG